MPKKPTRGRNSKYTQEIIDKLYNALIEHGGVVRTACEVARISYTTFYHWKEVDRFFAEKMDEAQRIGNENAIDESENALHKAIKEGNVPAIIFHLKTKGKGRGYVEKVEQQISGEVDIVCNFAEADTKKEGE